MANFLGLNQIGRFFRVVKENGGMLSSLYKMYRQDELMTGTLVGMDKFGNKYFQNKDNMFGRDRWVIYSPAVGTDYEGGQVSVDWFGWLHHKTDELPSEANRVQYSWISDPNQPNPSGTEGAYMPYSTTKPKIEAWSPPKK